MDRLQTLKKAHFFSSLSEPSLREISRYFSEEKYKRDDYIIFEGDPPEWLHIVQEGRVKLLKHSDTGKDIILQIHTPGDMFGEVALFDRKPYAVSAQAMEPTTILRMSRKDFLLFFGRHPFVATEMIIDLGRQLREAQATIKSLAVDRVEQRIAHILMKLADKVGVAEKSGVMINLPLTRQDLADMAGTTVETAIRVMSRFTKSKIIKPVDGKIFLLHPDSLQQIVE
ncbi:MAG TPA: Crp/Fnr family transcriptional regulator, partial [Thermodesulfobacteriota bacterium]|nr:Crp/Fnr family transcriptional regulator [Thermodesulfobacteriota bacterium]